MVILKVTKNQGSTLSLEYTFFEKPLGEAMKNFSVNISYFHRFSSIFGYFLITKKLISQLITDDVSIFSLSIYFKKIV